MSPPVVSMVLLHRALSDEDRRLLATVKVVDAGCVLARQGEPLASAHFVLSGLFSRTKALADGRRQITALLVPGDSCNLQDCFRGRNGCTLKAQTRSVVAEVPRAELLGWIETRPSFAHAVWQLSYVNTSILREWLLNIGHRSPAKRISHLVCELLVRLQKVGLAADGTFAFPLRQDEIAALTGLSTVHVNRTLQTLRADGLITLRRHMLIVHDVDRLKRFALFDDAYLQTADEPLASAASV